MSTRIFEIKITYYFLKKKISKMGKCTFQIPKIAYYFINYFRNKSPKSNQQKIPISSKKKIKEQKCPIIDYIHSYYNDFQNYQIKIFKHIHSILKILYLTLL